jgi:hypothetical protein
MSGERPDQADGTPANPKGTMVSRGVDKALGTDISGANPERKVGPNPAWPFAAAGRRGHAGQARRPQNIAVEQPSLLTSRQPRLSEVSAL